MDEDGSLDVGASLEIKVYDERGDSKHTSLGEVSFSVVGDVVVTLEIRTPNTQEINSYMVNVPVIYLYVTLLTSMDSYNSWSEAS